MTDERIDYIIMQDFIRIDNNLYIEFCRPEYFNLSFNLNKYYGNDIDKASFAAQRIMWDYYVKTN